MNAESTKHVHPTQNRTYPPFSARKTYPLRCDRQPMHHQTQPLNPDPPSPQFKRTSNSSPNPATLAHDTSADIPPRSAAVLISQKMFKKWFCKIQSPHKFVNLSLILLMTKDKLTALCGN